MKLLFKKKQKQNPNFHLHSFVNDKKNPGTFLPLSPMISTQRWVGVGVFQTLKVYLYLSSTLCRHENFEQLSIMPHHFSFDWKQEAHGQHYLPRKQWVKMGVQTKDVVLGRITKIKIPNFTHIFAYTKYFMKYHFCR